MLKGSSSISNPSPVAGAITGTRFDSRSLKHKPNTPGGKSGVSTTSLASVNPQLSKLIKFDENGKKNQLKQKQSNNTGLFKLPPEIVLEILQKDLSPKDKLNFSLANQETQRLAKAAFWPLRNELLLNPSRYQLRQAMISQKAIAGNGDCIYAFLDEENRPCDWEDMDTKDQAFGQSGKASDRWAEYGEKLPTALVKTQLFHSSDRHKINSLPLRGKLFLASPDLILAMTQNKLTAHQATALASLAGKEPEDRDLQVLVAAGYLNEEERAAIEASPEHQKYLLSNPVLRALSRGIQPDIQAFLRVRNPQFFRYTSEFMTTLDDNIVKSNLFIEVPDQNGCTPLLRACKAARVDFVKALIAKDANLHCVDKQGRNALLCTLDAKDDKTKETISILKVLLDAGVGIDQPSWFMGNTLHAAVRKENPEILQLLLSRSAKHGINQPDKSGHTPLYVAARLGNAALVQILFDNGGKAFINQPDKSGHTPLYMAARMGNAALVQILLDNGGKASINQPDTMTGDTLLHVTARLGNTALVQILLDNGGKAFINQPDTTTGYTPLHEAARTGNAALVQILFDNGAQASINQPDKSGHTPLYHAIDNHETRKAIKENAIILAKFDPPLADRGAVSRPRLQDVQEIDDTIKCLADHGATLSPRDKSELREKVLFGFVPFEAVKLCGAETATEIMDQLRQGKTLMHWAVRYGNTPLVKALIEAGADVKQVDEEGTLLHHAALYGDKEMVNALIERGAEVNQKDGVKEKTARE